MNPLTVEEIEDARIKVRENAHELLDEAELLLSNEKYARAYALAHLASEEMAKLPMLVSTAMNLLRGVEVDWKKFTSRFQKHETKIQGILIGDYLNDPNVESDEDIKRLLQEINKITEHNRLKNVSLYADFFAGSFRKPSEIIGRDIAKKLVALAKSRYEFYAKSDSLTQGKLQELVRRPDFEAFYRKLFEEV